MEEDFTLDQAKEIQILEKEMAEHEGFSSVEEMYKAADIAWEDYRNSYSF